MVTKMEFSAVNIFMKNWINNLDFLNIYGLFKILWSLFRLFGIV
jgi:hypothetical protein